MEGPKLERHPYLVMQEKLEFLKNKKSNLQQAVNSLSDEFFAGKSPYEQGVGYTKFQNERDKLNKEIDEIDAELKELNNKILLLEDKMKREN